MAFSRLAIVGLVLALAVSTFAHSYVTSPTSRSNQKQSNTGCRGPACLGPCDAPLSQARTPAVTIARGASINVQWPRNNHAGGFIRLAWARTDGSDIHANFDAGVQQISCHESGCKSDDPSTPNGGDSNPADGSKNPCRTTIQVPSHLTDGKWTLQWAWYGGAFALGDYYSCVDYVISGGSAVAAQKAAVFLPGDATYAASQGKCKFFNTDRLHKCVNEPCNSPIYALNQEQSGPAFMGNIVTPVPNPTPTPDPVPSTTGSKKPSTTGAVQVPNPTPKPSPTPNPSSTLNCAGLTQVATATTVTITEVQTWSNVFRMVMQINAGENLPNWNLQILWPADATSTEVNSVFNAGKLRCHANSPVHHAMISPTSWSTSIKKGESMTVEVIADNTNMAASFIQANTVVRVFHA